MLDLIETQVSAEKEKLCASILAAREPIYLLGRNTYARLIAQTLPIEAFVDDYAVESEFLGRPVLRMRDLPSHALVISCVVDGRPITALRRLSAAGARAIDYFSLHRIAPERFYPPSFCEGNRLDILTHRDDYAWVYEQLADQVSRDAFAAVVRFRLTFDLKCMDGFELAIDRQYFEPFLPLPQRGVFVDGGGYDGQTTRQFAVLAPDYRSIYFFEPSAVAMAQARSALAPLRDIHYVPCGLGAATTRMRFDASAGPTSRLSPEGGTEIDVVSIDDAVAEPITLLKLDIEGAEFDAIAGAANHIRADRPALAVCVYHDQRDFWRIPRRILELHPDYRVYLRHYSEGILETVMFFIPTA